MGTNLKFRARWGEAAIFAGILAACTACGGGGSSTPPPPTIQPPRISKSFGASGVALGANTALTFTISNPNSSQSLSGVGFTDNLPSGLLVSNPNGLSGTCGGGTITASVGASSVSLSAASLASQASCSFSVNVTGNAMGKQNNVTTAVTSTEGGNGATASASITVVAASQQPPEPTDITPIDGEVYYLVNQLSALQVDLNSGSITAGDHIVQQPRSFTNTSQRWAFTKLSANAWQVRNISNRFCFDSSTVSGVVYVVQNPCVGSTTQQWTLTPTSNGYYTVANLATGLALDVFQASTAGGAVLVQTVSSSAQSQQWLLRPAFLRGVDNALLEKQEAGRVSTGLTWWNDAGQPADVLAIIKNHGVNTIRLRPSSAPPYVNPSQTGCSGNACYAETDAQDLDLAKRVRNLGMSLELTLLFDGGSSSSVPSAWANHTLSQLQTDIYNYVRSEITLYRQNGVMPDLVSIGNEVDTGFLGSIGSPTGANFGGFAALQMQALQAVKDAAADTSIGPAIPAPLTCIHITPAWDITQFFTLANQYGIPYDAICHSYYPIFHGPLTDAQAAASNPGNKPIEQDVLNAAASNLGKPIFIIEAGEHYENGFDSNDPWYAPTVAAQRQFLLDLEGVQDAVSNNLGMGIAYWDPLGVNIPSLNGGFINGDNSSDAIYTWNGLTLFDNADSSGTTNVSAPNYSQLLSGMDALGGKLDSNLSYKFVNHSSGNLLSVFQGSNSSGALLDAEADSGTPSLSQQWRISSNQDGYFQVASQNPGAAATTNVLDDSGASSTSGTAIVQSSSNASQEQEWNVVSVGGGYFAIMNRVSGMVIDISGGTGSLAGKAVQEPLSSSSTTQQWQIIPVH
ncbi:MAG TPA: RICIN domain-containing protein [Candidatus Dormibacteraeota bacterium]|nr:RICIN domain-containing protein [Candidatus Dormibacteraeota bacterium]